MLFGKRKKNLEISRDCWNLNYSFITWLNERLPVYKEEAGKHIDLSYHNFTYKGERCSFAQLIDRMIELVSELDPSLSLLRGGSGSSSLFFLHVTE